MPLSFLGFLAIGAAIGGTSGMFGIGGGAFLVPAVLLLVAGFLAGSFLSAGYAIGLRVIYILTAR